LSNALSQSSTLPRALCNIKTWTASYTNNHPNSIQANAKTPKAYNKSWSFNHNHTMKIGAIKQLNAIVKRHQSSFLPLTIVIGKLYFHTTSNNRRNKATRWLESYRSFRPFSTVIPGAHKLTSGAESCVKKAKGDFLGFLVFVLLRPDGFFGFFLFFDFFFTARQRQVSLMSKRAHKFSTKHNTLGSAARV
jgi:hypothetical protein